MAGAAFKNAEVMKFAEKFVPVLVDGDVDKELGAQYGASGYPHSIFTDPRGKLVSKVVGAVPTDRFLDEMKAALKKIGPVAPKKAAKDLQDAMGNLVQAQGKSDWKAVLRASAAIEKINHEGAELKAARAAKEAAKTEAGKRLDEGKKLRADGKRPEARTALGKVASEFEGLDAAVEAKNLLKEMDAEDMPPKDGGGDGGGGKNPKSGK